MDTLFHKIGGDDAVKALVELFYSKIMVDSRINYFFSGVLLKGFPVLNAGRKSFNFWGRFNLPSVPDGCAVKFTLLFRIGRG